MKIGYVRQSLNSQGLEEQLQELEASGCEKIFSEPLKNCSKNRTTFIDMCASLHEGDILHVTKLDRLARSLSDLHKIAQKLATKRVDLIVLNQGIDTSSASGKVMLSMLGAIAEFERDLINERTKEGVKAAKQRGVKFGKPRKLSHKDAVSINNLMQMGESARSLSETYGVSTNTIYRAIERLEIKKV